MIKQIKKKKKWLSPTGIESSKRCQRCFWLRYNKKLYQPEGIVSRLANRFDTILKKYFDLYRPLGELPPMIEGMVEGKLLHPFQETYFYHHDEDYGYMGKLDETLISDKKKYTPLDFKTSSSDPNTKPLIPAYQSQMDSYAFLLEKNNRPTTGLGHLLFFFPSEAKDLHNRFPMQITLKTIKTNPQSAYNEFLGAIKILEEKIPDSSANCPFCNWRVEIAKHTT
ncbi:hypothetical protein IID19_00285 [Patescibacteria group bacterium]|nr:hypothetical protein [Patescibacteria group bacterium]